MNAINEQLFWWINGLAGGWADVPMVAVTASGYTVSAVVIALSAMRLYGGLNRKNVVLLAITLAIGGGIVHGIKQTWSVPRPLKHFARQNPPLDHKVNAPYKRLGSRTFPSGHSQTAFGVATFIVLLFKRHVALWLFWAGMVAISRVYLGLHFPLDIVAGSLLGAFTAFVTLKGGYRTEVGPPKARESEKSPS